MRVCPTTWAMVRVGSSGALLCVYMLASAAERWCRPLCLFPHHWRGILAIGDSVLSARRCRLRLDQGGLEAVFSDAEYCIDQCWGASCSSFALRMCSVRLKVGDLAILVGCRSMAHSAGAAPSAPEGQIPR